MATSDNSQTLGRTRHATHSTQPAVELSSSHSKTHHKVPQQRAQTIAMTTKASSVIATSIPASTCYLNRPPKFLRALYDILTYEPTHILTWAPCGSFFQVLDIPQLEQHVLPKYFKHNKFASFQRQLNNFGFRKWTKTRASVCTFSHDSLVRCAPSELAAMVVRCGVVSPHSTHSTSGAAGMAAKRTRSSSSDSSTGYTTEESEHDVKRSRLDESPLASFRESAVSVSDLLSLDWSVYGDFMSCDEEPEDDCVGLPIELFFPPALENLEPVPMMDEKSLDADEWELLAEMLS